MKRVKREQSRSRWGCFEPMEPCIEVNLNEDFVVECHSYGSGIITPDMKGTDHPGKLCLPIAIKGVLPSDTIAIHIRRLEIVGWGQGCIDGPLQHDEGFPGEPGKGYFIQIEDGMATLPGGLRTKVTPSLGHINVEPLGPQTPNPWYYGGNMDLAEICEGNTLYLRAEKENAKLVLGDSKAHVAEGEIAGEGIQSALDVTLNVQKSQKIQVERPFIESPTHWIAVGIHSDYWEAVKQAVRDLVRIVQDIYHLSFNEAYFWVTHFAHARNGAIWEMADPSEPLTVALHLPKPMNTL